VTVDETGLPQDSVVNVSQVITIDKSFLTEQVSEVSDRVMLLVEDGLRLVLAL
jgi:mRNA interferase MazF